MNSSDNTRTNDLAADGSPVVTGPGTFTNSDGRVITYDYVDTGGPEKKLLPTQIIERSDAPVTTWTTYDISPEELSAARQEEARMHQHAREVAAEISADRLLEYAESTRHRSPGQGFSLTHVGAARNPLCGDQMSLLLRIVGDRVAAIRFDARGCVISQAAAAILCEAVDGKPLEEVRAITHGQLLELIGIPLSPTRRACALLAFQCLQNALGDAPTDTA